MLPGKSDRDYYLDIEKHGDYQYTSFSDVINGFLISYVGEDKIIPKLKRTEVIYHAKRGLQELSYDTFKCIKGQEIQLPPSLTMILPRDYVNYVKLARVDANGIEHRIYPIKDTSNPFRIKQRASGEYSFDRDDDGNNDTSNLLHKHEVKVEAQATTILTSIGETGEETVLKHITLSNFTTGAFADLEVGMEILSTTENLIPADVYITSIDSTNNRVFINEPVNITLLGANVTFIKKESDSWKNFKTQQPAENNNDDFDYDDELFDYNIGQRYGLDPYYANVNGSFYIDENSGLIHFSSNLANTTIVLKYISDSLGTEEEMKVPKLAEEALYKYIAHNVLATRANVPEYIVNRFKREAYASKRKAKLRLSNLKIEELTQILRGKSKQIKH
tara:strand:- start:1770 stop:2939 length:1170 start_codon:yes stop_codon:yes gene_type:complete